MDSSSTKSPVQSKEQFAGTMNSTSTSPPPHSPKGPETSPVASVTRRKSTFIDDDSPKIDKNDIQVEYDNRIGKNNTAHQPDSPKLRKASHSSPRKLQLQQLQARLKLIEDEAKKNEYNIIAGEKVWGQDGEQHPLSGVVDINGKEIIDKTIKYKPPDCLTTITTDYNDPPQTKSVTLKAYDSKESNNSALTTDNSTTCCPTTCPFTSRSLMLEERKLQERLRCSAELDKAAMRLFPDEPLSPSPPRRAFRRYISNPGPEND